MASVAPAGAKDCFALDFFSCSAGRSNRDVVFAHADYRTQIGIQPKNFTHTAASLGGIPRKFEMAAVSV
jgi:hypothetical protein